MFEFADTRPDTDVQETEYVRLLGFPRHRALEGRSRELADWARDWFRKHGQPWVYARETDELDFSGDLLRVVGVEFSSRQIREQFNLAQTRSAVLVAVSAGRECEEYAQTLWREEKPDEYFFLEVFGSAMVEHLITVASGRICAWADANGMVALPHYSPGYSGWDVADQNKLWNLIRATNSLPGELRVLDSGMLQPKKSLLAIFGITAHVEKARSLATLVPCESCSLHACQFRRAAYRRARKVVL